MFWVNSQKIWNSTTVLKTGDLEQQKSIFSAPGIFPIFPIITTENLIHIWVWENVGQVMSSFSYTTNLKYLMFFM